MLFVCFVFWFRLNTASDFGLFGCFDFLTMAATDFRRFRSCYVFLTVPVVRPSEGVDGGPSLVAAVAEDAGFQAHQIVLLQGGPERLAQVHWAADPGVTLDLFVGEGDLLTAASVLGLKADGKSDDGSDRLDHRQRFVRDDDIEKLVGDVRAIAFTLEESPEVRRLLSILWRGVPTELVARALAGFTDGIGAPFAHALDEMPGHGLIKSQPDHVSADAGLGDEFAVTDGHLLLLWVAVGVAPAEGFADEMGDQTNDPA